jgi:hypothetical protein
MLKRIDKLTRNELKQLAAYSADPSVSIFMPTAKAGKAVEKNPIRFKNLLREAGRRIEASGDARRRSRHAVDTLLQPARELLQDSAFWRHQELGLAFFLAPDWTRRYRLPISPEEICVVGRRFHLNPLLPLVSGSGRFQILCVRRDGIELYSATRHDLHRVTLQQTPERFEGSAAASGQRELQWHTGTPGGRGKRAAVFHGRHETDQETELRKYYCAVAESLASEMEDRSAPVVLVGLPHLLSVYRDADQESNLCENEVRRNPDSTDPDSLLELAWQAVEPVFASGRRAAGQEFLERSNTGRSSDDLEEILPASFEGRVESLLVAPGYHRWGSYDPATRRIRSSGSDRVENEDLVDLVAVRTLSQGGDVFVVPEEEMPSDARLAAVYRY